MPIFLLKVLLSTTASNHGYGSDSDGGAGN